MLSLCFIFLFEIRYLNISTPAKLVLKFLAKFPYNVVQIWIRQIKVMGRYGSDVKGLRQCTVSGGGEVVCNGNVRWGWWCLLVVVLCSRWNSTWLKCRQMWMIVVEVLLFDCCRGLRWRVDLGSVQVGRSPSFGLDLYDSYCGQKAGWRCGCTLIMLQVVCGWKETVVCYVRVEVALLVFVNFGDARK